MLGIKYFETTNLQHLTSHQNSLYIKLAYLAAFCFNMNSRYPRAQFLVLDELCFLVCWICHLLPHT